MTSGLTNEGKVQVQLFQGMGWHSQVQTRGHRAAADEAAAAFHPLTASVAVDQRQRGAGICSGFLGSWVPGFLSSQRLSNTERNQHEGRLQDADSHH